MSEQSVGVEATDGANRLVACPCGKTTAGGNPMPTSVRHYVHGALCRPKGQQ